MPNTLRAGDMAALTPELDMSAAASPLFCV